MFEIDLWTSPPGMIQNSIANIGSKGCLVMFCMVITMRPSECFEFEFIVNESYTTLQYRMQLRIVYTYVAIPFVLLQKRQ